MSGYVIHSISSSDSEDDDGNKNASKKINSQSNSDDDVVFVNITHQDINCTSSPLRPIKPNTTKRKFDDEMPPNHNNDSDFLPDVHELLHHNSDNNLDILPAVNIDGADICSETEKSADDSSSTSSSEIAVVAAKSPKKRSSKEEKQKEKELQKQEKLRLRLEKRQAAKRLKEKEKALKRAKLDENRNSKPKDSVKTVTVNIDSKFLENKAASEIRPAFEANEIVYETRDQIIANCVTWSRTVTQIDPDNSVIVPTTETVEEDQILVYVPVEEFLKKVQASKENAVAAEDNLSDFIELIQSVYSGKFITLMVLGVEKFFKTQNSKKQKEYRTRALGGVAVNNSNNNKTARRKNGNVAVEITRVQLEEEIIKLQFNTQCNLLLIDSQKELAEAIVYFTKSVAQAPYKRDKMKVQGLSWYAAGDNKGGVKVDKDGNGRQELWVKQLQQFNNVSVDAAKAIAAQYPSPKSLQIAYLACASRTVAEKLLMDINVQRFTGAHVSNRRVGIELSRKIHLFMTSENGEISLSTT